MSNSTLIDDLSGTHLDLKWPWSACGPSEPAPSRAGANPPGTEDFDLRETESWDGCLDRLRRGQIGEAADMAEAILAAPAAAEATSVALTAYGLAAWRGGLLAQAVSLLRAGVARAADRDSPDAICPHVVLASVLTGVDHFEEAAAVLLGAIRMCPGADGAWAARIGYVGARLHLATGDLDEARSWASASLRAAERNGEEDLAIPAHSVLAAVARHGRETSEAAHHIRHFQDEPAASHHLYDLPLLELRTAWLVQAQHSDKRAWQALGRLIEDRDARRRLFLHEPAAAAFMVRTALTAGERATAASFVEAMEELAGRNVRFPALAAAAMHSKGLVHSCPEHFRQAAGLYSRPWTRASALEDLGTALGPTSRDDARDALHQSASLYRAAAARADEARVQARIRGLDSPRKARRTRPVEGWGSLTDCERKVAVLVSEGLTNYQVAGELYVSRHTVDFHLRSIYRKLNVHSRVHLTRMISRQEYN